jgi:hypothetical protein
LLYDNIHDMVMFGMIERCALAGCTAWDQSIDPVGNLKLDECTKRSFVDCTVGALHRRDKCGGDSFE